MGINWFEGGRRVSYLISGIGILIGALVIYGSGPTPYVIFETETPDDAWTYTTKPCDYPDVDEYTARTAYVDGRDESVIMCFRTQESKILYQRAEQDASKQWTYWTNDRYNNEVEKYIFARKEAFRTTPDMIRAANAGFPKYKWAKRKSHVIETVKWTGAFLLFMFAFTVVIGWIVRGFAGIPKGQDFRPKS